MVEKWNITIPELTGDEERSAYVYLPESYETEPDMRYPVLYMFDGHNVFFDEDATYGKCWGMKEYMDDTETPLIIAAVECNHSPDHGRLSEYSPFSFRTPEFGSITGRGKITMDWLTGTFKPFIDENFRTLPDRKHTFIAGSSMGGLMSLYAVVKYNHIFSKAAALSPSLWVSAPKLSDMIKKARIRANTVVYMDYGSREFRNHEGIRDQFAAISTLLLKKKVLLETRIVPGGSHCEASWEKQIPFFMNTLLYEP
ncbi:alpha/beta hydrolase [Faecalicatena contorta]|uniref:alpha/beta hydrolase n=1 Tax=Faecalicatena contorta TaxID=39482 RepID=UPI001EEC0B00|nr:alpha/beta hydrolase-fold protein [Faecalicatena contorta]MCF2553579.1 alpha/beta hydrolase [Faecalicatena contorta]MCF2680194.1 alpha/beta hydrolase [Faecalicatena contorta]